MVKPIGEIVQNLGLSDDEVEPFGRDKVKLTLDVLTRRARQQDGKFVLVTAINPTPAGEGKTVTTISLGDGLSANKKRAVVCIREPSLGPTFGVKGGGAGGGRAQAHPSTDLNLHFTGDAHAIGAAHNLIAALVDAHVYHGNAAGFHPHGVAWNRVLDVTDRSLRHIVTGLGGKAHGTPREAGFDITAASELMALLALSEDHADMRRRLGHLVLGTTRDGQPITAARLEVAGPAAVLLRDALRPNLIQTLEGTPLLAHLGPFGNIATGHNSVLEDRMALKLADVVGAEAGFGSDLGFEKFCHLVAPVLGRGPDAAVIVATIRGLKAHSGHWALKVGQPLPKDLESENLDAVRTGAANLKAHIENVRQFGVAAIVSVNRFASDTEREIDLVKQLALDAGAHAVAVNDAFHAGGAGARELADVTWSTLEKGESRFRPLFAPDAPAREKVEILARRVYRASGVKWTKAAEQKMSEIDQWGFGKLGVCVAKTAFSLSHDGDVVGVPKDYVLPIVDVALAAGAGFIKIFCGDILTMPGFSTRPAALKMDLGPRGEFIGL